MDLMEIALGMVLEVVMGREEGMEEVAEMEE